MKRAYRKKLSLMGECEDSTVIGKRNFLEIYRLARIEGLSNQNIRAGWKATGLWPVARAKPLLSPLLLENSQQRTQKPVNSNIEGLNRPSSTPLSILKLHTTTWTTPRKARDLTTQLTEFNNQLSPTPAQRNLFRKITKGFDEKDFQLATAHRRIQALETKVESMRPRKRKKVEISPNSKFATIEDVQRAQIAAGAVEDSLVEENGSELSGDDEDCIIVRG